MTKLTRLLLVTTFSTFLGFFVVEAILWPMTWVQALLVPQLNPHLPYSVALQADVLRTLFINQAAYNLLLGTGGFIFLHRSRKGPTAGAIPILRYLCIIAIGAAITLLSTTQAYVLGLVQFAFPAAALWSLRHE